MLHDWVRSSLRATRGASTPLCLGRPIQRSLAKRSICHRPTWQRHTVPRSFRRVCCAWSRTHLGEPCRKFWSPPSLGKFPQECKRSSKHCRVWPSITTRLSDWRPTSCPCPSDECHCLRSQCATDVTTLVNNRSLVAHRSNTQQNKAWFSHQDLQALRSLWRQAAPAGSSTDMTFPRTAIWITLGMRPPPISLGTLATNYKGSRWHLEC